MPFGELIPSLGFHSLMQGKILRQVKSLLISTTLLFLLLNRAFPTCPGASRTSRTCL